MAAPRSFRFGVQTFSADSEGLGAAFGLSREEMLQHPHALIGTIEGICQELQRRREGYGFSYVTVGDDVMDAFAPVVAKLG